jgi:hypothetical protein
MMTSNRNRYSFVGNRIGNTQRRATREGAYPVRLTSQTLITHSPLAFRLPCCVKDCVLAIPRLVIEIRLHGRVTRGRSTRGHREGRGGDENNAFLFIGSTSFTSNACRALARFRVSVAHLLNDDDGRSSSLDSLWLDSCGAPSLIPYFKASMAENGRSYSPRSFVAMYQGGKFEQRTIWQLKPFMPTRTL